MPSAPAVGPLSTAAPATPERALPSSPAVAYESASSSDGSTTTAGGDGVMPSASITTGVQTVWVSVESVTTGANDDANSITADGIQSLVAAMNAYWRAQSEGAVSVVLGGIETRSLTRSSCSGADVFSTAPTVAFDGRFARSAWQGTGDHLLVLTREACGAAGIGSVGGDGGVIVSGNGTGAALGVPVALHEFGHNLGFGHAGSSMCTNTTSVDAVDAASFAGPASSCPTDEYGDYLDIMGYTMSNATPGLSSAQRIRAGYLREFTDVTQATSPVTTTLTPLEGTGSNRALRVTDPRSGSVYYVEFRAASGQDASSTEFTQAERRSVMGSYTKCARGVSAFTGVVRILRELPRDGSMQYIRTTVLAVGSAASRTRSTHLAAGSTFVSADAGVYVSVDAVNGTTSASVTVQFTAPVVAKATTTKVATKTVLRLTRKVQTYRGTVQTRATLSAMVTSSSGRLVKGTVRFYDGTRLLGQATVTSKHTAKLLAPASLKVGVHQLQAAFVPATKDALASHSVASPLHVARRGR